MTIRDALNGFWLGLRKGPVINVSRSPDMVSVNGTDHMIPATPGLGQVDVVNTLELPTSNNVPTRWAHTFLGPGQPFAGQINQNTRDKDAELEPRSMQYIANINSTITPRISWGLIPFADLRTYAETVPEVAGVVRLLTEEMKAFIPSLVDDEDNDVDIPELEWMLHTPDRVNPWPVWLSRFMYNVLVYDAPAVYKIRDTTYLSYTRSQRAEELRKGTVPRVELVNDFPETESQELSAHLQWNCAHCGAANFHPLEKSREMVDTVCADCGIEADDITRQLLLGPTMMETLRKDYLSPAPVVGLRIIDGSTLFALIDEKGEQPSPPAPAFTQVIWGVPRMFLNRNQVWYRPRFLRADAPYGRSFIEDALPAVKLLSKLWEYEGAKYIAGNLPEMGMECPPTWTSADQILDYEDAYNARMAGNETERAGRIRFFPSGMKAIAIKELQFNKESYDAATNSVRMAAGVPKTEAGEQAENSLGGTGQAEAMQSAFYRMGLAPLQTFIEGMFNDIIHENGYDRLFYKLRFPSESIDPEKEETKWQGRFVSGVITRDEARQGMGIDKLGGEEGKYLVTPGGGKGEGEGADGGVPGGIGVKKPEGATVPVASGAKPVSVLKNPVAVLQHPVGVKKAAGEWDEGKHPRAEDGKFGTSGGGSKVKIPSSWNKKENLSSDGSYLIDADNSIYSIDKTHSGALDELFDENNIEYKYGAIDSSIKHATHNMGFIRAYRDDAKNGSRIIGFEVGKFDKKTWTRLQDLVSKTPDVDEVYIDDGEKHSIRIPVSDLFDGQGLKIDMRGDVQIMKAAMPSLDAFRPKWADPNEFMEGMAVEQEHSDITGGDIEETAKIVIAHLREAPDYYTRLKAVEKDEGAPAAGMNTGNAPNGVYLVGQDEDDLEKGEEHTGVMVAIPVPVAASMKVEIGWPPDSEPVPDDEMHVTLAYYGEIKHLDTGPENFFRAVEQFAAQAQPFDAKINGVGRFLETHKDGMECLWLSLDAPELPEFRQAIVQHMDQNEFHVLDDHGFIPHITLAYYPKGKRLPDYKFQAHAVKVTHLRAAWGDEVHDFPFMSNPKPDEADGLAKFDNLLRKHCGTCAEDDQWFGSHVSKPVDALMPHQGANVSQIVTIGGKILEPRPAVWKPVSGEKPDLVEWAGGKLYLRAEAAYLLDRELAPDEDHYLIPVTWCAEVDGEQGSVQHFVKGGKRKEVDAYDSDYIEQAAVLDYVMGQLDRVRKNYLTHPDNDRRPVLIDSDLSFSPNPGEKIRSSFIETMLGLPLSEVMYERLHLLTGNRDLWQDLTDVLQDADAVMLAKDRAQRLYDDEGFDPGLVPPLKGPEPQATEDPATTATDKELHKAEFDESKHPHSAENGQFVSTGGEGTKAPDDKPDPGTPVDPDYIKPAVPAPEGAKKHKMKPEAASWQNIKGHMDKKPAGEMHHFDFSDGRSAIAVRAEGKYGGKLHIVAYGKQGGWRHLVENSTGSFDLVEQGPGTQKHAPIEAMLTEQFGPDLTVSPEPKAVDAPEDLGHEIVDKPEEKPAAAAYTVEPATSKNWWNGGAWYSLKTKNKQPWTNESHERFGQLISNVIVGDAELKKVPGSKDSYHLIGKDGNEIRIYGFKGAYYAAYMENGIRVGELSSGDTPTHAMYAIANSPVAGGEPEKQKADKTPKQKQSEYKPRTANIAPLSSDVIEQLKGFGRHDAERKLATAGANNERMNDVLMEMSGVKYDPTDYIEGGSFDKNYLKAQALQNAGYDQRGSIKNKIVTALSKKTGITYDKVNELIHTWAKTSNDHNPTSLQLQSVVSEEFGVELSKWQKDKINSVDINEYNTDLTREETRIAVHAMYNATQEHFKEMGLGPEDEITLFRGCTINGNKKGVGEIVKVHGNACESWSTSPDVSDGFGTMKIMTNVKVKDVLGSCVTGFGCLTECELVCLGGKYEAVITKKNG